MKKILVILATAMTLFSCNYVSRLVHEGELVAKAGSGMLYSTELETYIPKGLSPEDSAGLAQQYIRSWATEQLYEEIAKKELSKADLDVSKELDEYRRSLLKYRYEQSYINQRLDTAVTESQIEEYYDSHKEQMRLALPVVRARFVTVLKNSPNLTHIRKQIAVEDEDGMHVADSVLSMSTVRNQDYGGKWIEAPLLAREFGTDYLSMLSLMKNGYIESEDESGNHNIAYVYEIVRSGAIAPVEYYMERIKDVILSARKQALLNDLEQDLLEKALSQGDYVIY